MALPPPPSASATKAAILPPTPVKTPVAVVPAPVVAVTAPVVVAEVAGDVKAPVWGAKDLVVPQIAGQDPIALLNNIVAYIVSQNIDIVALAEGFATTPKTSYPSTKYGRAAYALGNSIISISKNHAQLSKTRAARTGGKPRVSKVEKFKSGIEALAKQFGGMDKISGILGADFLKTLGL